jgi:hypothetical protein
MTKILTGKRVCIGCKPEYATMPITNLPVGTIKVRRKIRNDRAAVAFVKTENTVEKWILVPDGDTALKIDLQQGINRFK